MYREVVVRAAGLAASNWPVAASLFVYAGILLAVGWLAMMLGMVGGLIAGLIVSACIASFLYLVEMIVRTSKVTLEDFRRSFAVYLWDVVGVTFVFWLFWTLVAPVLARQPQGHVIVLCVQLAFFVFFNAVPELIYLGHHSALALLAESYRFVSENWIEWFSPNLLLLAVFGAVAGLPTDGVAMIVQQGVLALFVYFAMIVRGLLFIELNGTTRRARVFRYRARG
jgi:hypothetical protein